MENSLDKSIVRTLKLCFKEKFPNKSFEDSLYKADKVFDDHLNDDSPIYNYHLNILEKDFGVHVYDYLLKRQEIYMNRGCREQRTVQDLKNYLKTKNLRNGKAKLCYLALKQMLMNMK